MPEKKVFQLSVFPVLYQQAESGEQEVPTQSQSKNQMSVLLKYFISTLPYPPGFRVVFLAGC